MILVQKDNDGFTVYHSVTSGVYLKYWTWSAFAQNYGKSYKYFKYIKWPGAPAFSSKSAPSSVRLTSNNTEGAIGVPITFTASAVNASDFTVSISGSNYSYTSQTFSTSTTWTPTKAGTYTVKLCARNEIGNTYSTDLKITVYDKKPSAPQISMSASTVVEGQNISIKWGESKNVITYNYEILKGGITYKKGTTNADHTLHEAFPKGSYTIKVTAINPLGETTSTATFKVTEPASSGQCGDNAYWSVNTDSGTLTITGTGEMYDYDSYKTNTSGTSEIVHTAPWYVFADRIKMLEISEGITTVGEYSFSELVKLEYVSFPETLHTISERAFLGDLALKGMLYHWGGEIRTSSGLVIPASVQYLGKYAFGNCDSLSDVLFCHSYDNLPQTADGYSPFYKCENLDSLSFAGGNSLPFGANKYDYSWSMSLYHIRTFMDLQGGSASGIENKMQSYNTKYMLPDAIPEKEGYTFIGWFTDPTGGYQVTEETTVTIGVPHNLYARWEAKEYTVSLDTVGGSLVNERTRSLSNQNNYELSVSYWSEYGYLPTPELAGSIFAGWSTSPEGGEIITEDTICQLSKDQVLYATWLDADGEDNSDYVEIHDWVAATCTTPKTCYICGATEGEALGHDYATAWTKDGTNHWHTCTVCSVKVDEGKHTPGAPATETTAQTCTACGYIITPAFNHTHNFATTWTTDDINHWHTCDGCEEQADLAVHCWYNGLCAICSMSDPNAAQPTDPVPTESMQPTDSAKNPLDNGAQSNNYNLVWVWIFSTIALAAVTIGVILYKKKH